MLKLTEGVRKTPRKSTILEKHLKQQIN